MQKIRIRDKLSLKGSSERCDLATHIRFIRSHDIGKGEWHSYVLKRALEHSPFKEQLVEVLKEKLASGKVTVLEKGVGYGNMLATIKQFAPDKIVTTGLTLADVILAENRPFIDKRIIGIGLKMRYGEKFDIIYDSYGEDNNLILGWGKFVYASLANSISHLKRNGVLFTHIRLSHGPSTSNMVVLEGKKLVKRLKCMKKISVIAKPVRVKISEGGKKHNWIDLVLEINRK